MAAKLDKQADPEAYLRKKGWKKAEVNHPWAWHQPPLPGLYTLKDAVDLQQSLDKQRIRK